MSTKKINLATGYSDFSDIRTNGLLYIDKTKYIHNLISNLEFKNWFLARPRRFGKSMFVNTLENFFRGREELFRGLFIHSLGYKFEPNPVIRLDMDLDSFTPEVLRDSILYNLKCIAKNEGLSLDAPNPRDALKSLVDSLWKKYGERKVVVLIDEYDKPILDLINKPDLAKEIRNVLRNFYIGLKSVENKLRFVFVTGISKFGKTAIHSALNNLNDITHDVNYAGICGYTETEFKDNFSPLFDGLINSLVSSGIFDKKVNNNFLINFILAKYNGYSWDGKTKILNPYSINYCFSKQKLDNYWMKTGPPLLLEHAMAQNPTDYLQPNLKNLLDEEVDNTEIDDLSPVAVLFQTGYLTISEIIPVPGKTNNDDRTEYDGLTYYYTLKIPNNEVLKSYNKGLFKHLFPLLAATKQRNNCYSNIINAIMKEDSTELADILHAQLARIPYPLHAERTKKRKLDPELGEFHFHAVFLNFFDGLGLKIIKEAMSSQGRSDIDIFLPNNVYAVLELKYISYKSDKSKSSDKLSNDIEKKADEAIEQLKNTLQDKKYHNQASRIIIAGIVIYDHDSVFVKFTDYKTHSIS
jgi:hypothetical protein